MKKSLPLLKSLSGIVCLIGIWQVTAGSQSLPKFMLPSPVDVVMAAKNNWQIQSTTPLPGLGGEHSKGGFSRRNRLRLLLG